MVIVRRKQGGMPAVRGRGAGGRGNPRSRRGKAESHSPAPVQVAAILLRRNHVMVDVVGSSQDRSIIDLTSTGTQRVPGSDEEE